MGLAWGRGGVAREGVGVSRRVGRGCGAGGGRGTLEGGRWGRGVRVRVRGGKYHVPMGVDGMTPERKGAGMLVDYFTFVSVEIVLAQIEAHQKHRWWALKEYIQEEFGGRITGDDTLRQMMLNPMWSDIAVRVAEVRKMYITDEDGFEWDNLKRLAGELAAERNRVLMVQHVMGAAQFEGGPEAGEGDPKAGQGGEDAGGGGAQ